MATPKLTKQPWEAILIDADFGLNMQENESILSGTATAYDSSNTDVSSTLLDQATFTIIPRTKLAVRVRAGTDGSSPYKVTFRCTTSTGNKWELDVPVEVAEI